MQKVSLLITDSQYVRLKELSKSKNMGIAELHRQALDEFIKGDIQKRVVELEAKVEAIELEMKALKSKK